MAEYTFRLRTAPHLPETVTSCQLASDLDASWMSFDLLKGQPPSASVMVIQGEREVLIRHRMQGKTELVWHSLRPRLRPAGHRQ